MMLCCMLPTLFRGQSTPETKESDSWYVSYGIQEAYNAITEEVDVWRERAEIRRSKNRFSFLSLKKSAFFVVDEAVPPKLYRVNDEQSGNISFEFTEVEGGGTSVKSMYDSKSRALVQGLKAKMPTKIPASGPKVCPSCGREIMPDFKVCPFCGTRIR